MAIHGAGTPIKFSEIQTEFGGVNPISLSEYYAGGPYVQVSPALNPGIPASGPVYLSGFYGAVKQFVFSYTVASGVSVANFNLAAAASSAGWNGVAPISAIITINSGGIIYSTSTTTPALVLSTVPSYSAISVINSGYIVGCGGKGSSGCNSVGDSGVINSAPGSPGGPALQILVQNTGVSCRITNNGTIGGGGGGGGGGSQQYLGNGPGGGGGAGYGLAGVSPAYSNRFGYSVTAGGNGTLTAGGAASSSTYTVTVYGGAGGGLGSAGAPGAASVGYGGPGAGGAAGAATVGYANATWVATGTLLGSLT
ncbi:MAG TPA: hypothetical protein VFM18_18355 [Methanosarcina sp.]|nr:hypothetical protein [Methanosarcina sp.]